MAILQLYVMVEQSETEVTYRYGYPEKDRDLTFRPVDGTYVVEDGREDHATRAVIREILWRRREESAWPSGGGVQH